METFWGIGGNYNNDTIIVQILMEVLLFAGFIMVDFINKQKFVILVKVLFAIEFIWIGIEYFLIHGISEYNNILNSIPFFVIGLCWIEDAINKRTNVQKTYGNKGLYLYLIWPLFIVLSLFVGRIWPNMFGIVFPCNTITMSLIWLNIHSSKKNYILTVILVLMATPGGLFNVFYFKVYEDWTMVLMGIITLINFSYQYKIGKTKVICSHVANLSQHDIKEIKQYTRN